jgi:predicted TIM-barrel fold metal-dependent hydrolase
MTPEKSTDAPIVDSHAHVYTTDMPLSATAWHKPPADATIEQYIATLDEHGVQYAVLAAASLFDDYNEYQIEAARKYKRLRTTAIVRPAIDPYIMRMMKDDGVVGIRLQWRNVKPPRTSRRRNTRNSFAGCAIWTGMSTSTRPRTSWPPPSRHCRRRV